MGRASWLRFLKPSLVRPVLLASLTTVSVLAFGPSKAPASSAAMAQSADTQPPQDRADELRATPELVCTEPDEFKRIENMEAIARSGDVVKSQIAIRCAMASDDPILRGVAFRAYIATVGEMRLNMIPGQKEMAAWEQREEEREREIIRRFPILSYVASAGFNLTLRILDFDFASGKGKLSVSNNERPVAAFTIGSDKLVFTTIFPTHGTSECSYEIRPNQEYKLTGGIRCKASGWTPVSLEGEMF
jgi:hypothetical protein